MHLSTQNEWDVTSILNNSLVPIRWMGCKLAVYELMLPSESGRKVRKNPCGTRRRNRRGRRSGVKKNRKCRNVTVADPVLPPPPGPQRGRFARRIYLVNRREELQKKLLAKIKRLDNKRKASTLPEAKRRIRMGVEVLRKRWVSLSSAASHDTPVFCRIKLRLLETITEDSWASMPTNWDYGPSDIVYSSNQDVAPPRDYKVPKKPLDSTMCCSRKVFKRRPVCQRCGTSYYQLFKDRSLEEDKLGSSVSKEHRESAAKCGSDPPTVLPELTQTVPSEVMDLIRSIRVPQ
jgi:hypothetical protein